MLCYVPSYSFQLLKGFTKIGTKCLTLATLTTLGFIAGILTQGIGYTLNLKEFLFLSLFVCLFWSRFCWHVCWLWILCGFLGRQWAVFLGFILITFFQVIFNSVLTICTWSRRVLKEILVLINKEAAIHTGICFLQLSICQVPATAEGWQKVASEFNNKWNYLCCIRALDGKHIAI